MSSVSSVSAADLIQQIKADGNGEIDPFAILNAHVAAIGGYDEVTGESNSYYYGDITLNDQTYTIRNWEKNPNKHKRELWMDDERVYANGDNGSLLWEKRYTDPATSFDDSNSPDRKVREAMKEWEYLDPTSSLFEVKTEGVTYIDGRKHYEVKVSNRMTDDVTFFAYDAQTMLLSREREFTGGQMLVTRYDDYQDVSGVLKAFTINTENVSTGVKQAISINGFKRNTIMEDRTFEVPSNSLSAQEKLEEIYESM